MPPPRGIPPPRGMPPHGISRGPPQRRLSRQHLPRGPPPRGPPPRGLPYGAATGPIPANGQYQSAYGVGHHQMPRDLGPRANSLVANDNKPFMNRRASYSGTSAAYTPTSRSQESAHSMPVNILNAPPSHLQTYVPNVPSGTTQSLGTLTVKCVEAVGLAAGNESSIFTKADPYVKLILGDNEKRTKIKMKAGSQAVRNHSIHNA